MARHDTFKFTTFKFTFWKVVFLFLMAAGLYATFVRFTQGLGASTHLSDQFPWGIWISFDVLCGVMLAAGLLDSLLRPPFTFSISSASTPSSGPRFSRHSSATSWFARR